MAPAASQAGQDSKTAKEETSFQHDTKSVEKQVGSPHTVSLRSEHPGLAASIERGSRAENDEVYPIDQEWLKFKSSPRKLPTRSGVVLVRN